MWSKERNVFFDSEHCCALSACRSRTTSRVQPPATAAGFSYNMPWRGSPLWK
ncbi:hypothetical protein BDV37DRAFT_141740 [Aspergillus pseudonomiae]|uniref:Uncharacterized protein n=1 Tax=Aspergillus pseudonomiae TaxID=1506151 RepID=A0A5N7DRT0_9EURO|nr:uncharacterized protein BDV37DRAFT_141740 [Aspergillus pseudonomiae]KAE8409086.1 hypothetical protein BDV37DRAFT_141740 [Aspergillus pseudonomiae]